MIQRVAILVGVPVLLAILVALPLGLWRGEYQWLCAGLAVGLIVPPGLVTLVVADRLATTSPFGPLLGSAVGTAVRLVFGFGGAVAVFLLWKPVFQTDPISFFGWVLGIYLTTLVTETTLLAGMKRPAPVGPPGA